MGYQFEACHTGESKCTCNHFFPLKELSGLSSQSCIQFSNFQIFKFISLHVCVAFQMVSRGFVHHALKPKSRWVLNVLVFCCMTGKGPGHSP